MSRPLLVAAMACAFASPGIASAAELKLRALLSAGSVVSATESLATGEARALLEEDNDMRIDLVYSGLEERATGAALRLDKPGENGPLVERFDVDADTDTDTEEGRVVGAQFEVSAEVAGRLRAGEAYLVITTIEHPDGLIRGQLTPEPARLRDPRPTLPTSRD